MCRFEMLLHQQMRRVRAATFTTTKLQLADGFVPHLNQMVPQQWVAELSDKVADEDGTITSGFRTCWFALVKGNKPPTAPTIRLTRMKCSFRCRGCHRAPVLKISAGRPSGPGPVPCLASSCGLWQQAGRLSGWLQGLSALQEGPDRPA